MRNAKHPSISLIDHLKKRHDPHLNQTRDHESLDILIIGICTLLCGGETFNDMKEFDHAKREWFKTSFSLPTGIPSHDAFNRVFSALDSKAFLDCFLNWTPGLRQAVDKEVVAMDGKALERAWTRGQSLKHVVSDWAEAKR